MKIKYLAYIIPIAALLLGACDKLTEASTKEMHSDEAVIEMDDDDFVVVVDEDDEEEEGNGSGGNGSGSGNGGGNGSGGGSGNGNGGNGSGGNGSGSGGDGNGGGSGDGNGGGNGSGGGSGSVKTSNKFSLSKPVDYYTLEGVSDDIKKYNKSHVTSIECKSATLVISTADGSGTIVRNLTLASDNPNSSQFTIAEYKYGTVIQSDESRKYANEIAKDILARDKVIITGTGKTDAPAGTHLKLKLILEDVTVKVSLVN